MRSIAVRGGVAAVLVALSLSALPAIAVATTSTIDRDTTWTAEEGPYVLTGNVIVAPGATLTIEPGTRIEGEPGAALIVRGVLRARGTPGRPVTFTSRTDERWRGIRLVGTGTRRTQDTRSEIVHAVVNGATIAVGAIYDSPRLAKVRFERNVSALLLVLPAGDVDVRSSQFLRNASAITGRTTLATITISDSDFWANQRTLLAGHKRPYDCGPDRGSWRLVGNDLLRGPGQRWHSGDIHSLPGSGNSNVAIDMRDNYWGTTNAGSVAGRIRELGEPYWGDLHADATRKPILVDPLSPAANTLWEPPGPAGSPDQESSLHGDPLTWQQITRPQQGRCYRATNLDDVRGEAGDAMGRLTSVEVAVVKRSGAGCRWLRNRNGALATRGCGDPVWLDPDGLRQWRLPLHAPLPAGRYVAMVRTNGGSRNGLGVDRMEFTVSATR